MGEGEVRDIYVSVEGTYMTRDRTSNIDVSTVIGFSTGKVLDTGSLTKHVKAVIHGEGQMMPGKHWKSQQTLKGCDSWRRSYDARL